MDAISHSSGWYWSFATGGPGGQQFPAGSFSSAGHSPGMQQEPPKSNFLKYFLIIGGVLLLLCCGCGGAFFYLGYAGFQQGMGAVGSEMVKPYENDPVVQQHIGKISKATMNFSAIMEEAQKNPNNGQGAIIVDVEGDKGKGRIIGKPGQGPGQQIMDAKLRLPTGEEFPLAPIKLGEESHEGHDHGPIELPAGSSEETEKSMPTETEVPGAEGSSESSEPAEAASN